MSVQRWQPYYGYDLCKADDGFYVSFHDHEQALLSLSNRCRELEAALRPFTLLGGNDDGVCAAYHDLPSDVVIYENS